MKRAEPALSSLFDSLHLSKEMVEMPILSVPTRMSVAEFPYGLLTFGWEIASVDTYQWALGEQSLLRFRTSESCGLDAIELMGQMALNSPRTFVTLRHVASGTYTSTILQSGITALRAPQISIGANWEIELMTTSDPKPASERDPRPLTYALREIAMFVSSNAL
jgi:hypothetical protein